MTVLSSSLEHFGEPRLQVAAGLFAVAAHQRFGAAHQVLPLPLWQKIRWIGRMELNFGEAKAKEAHRHHSAEDDEQPEW